jgi:anti-sigma factor RsiW
MICSDVSSLIPLYLTGELDEARARELNRHMRDCAECASEVSQQAAFDARLRAAVLAEPVDSKPVETRVLQTIAAEKRPGTWRWGLTAAGIAAALVAGVTGVLGYRAAFSHNFATVATGAVAAAARDHRMEIVDRQPRRWRTDLASVNELAAREGISTAMIAAIAPADYHFQEGKLCKLDGQIYLHLVYSDLTGKRNFSLFLDRQNDGTGKKAIYSASLGAECIAGFAKDRHNAMVVTDQSPDAALQFARFAASVI